MKSSFRLLIPAIAILTARLSAQAATDGVSVEPQAPAEEVRVPAPAPEVPAAPEIEVAPPVVAPEPPATPEPPVLPKPEKPVPPPKKKESGKPSSPKIKAPVPTSESVSHENEWDASIQVFLPDSTYWSSALGLSAERVYWQWDRLGWGFNLALAQWDAAAGVVDMPFAKFNDFTLSGSEQIIQLGLLGAYRRPLGSRTSLVLKAGLAYLMTQSDLELTASYVDHYNQHVSYSILADNVQQLVGRVEIAIRKNVVWGKKDMYVQAGLDYQARLAGDDPGFLQEDFRMSLDAPSLRLGLGWRW